MNETEISAIIAETQAFTAAMNAGDAALAASFYTVDGRRVGAFGDVQDGREEIAAAYDRLLHVTMPGARLTQELGTVRMLSPGLAVWQGALEIVIPGSEVPLRGHVVQLMKKIEGRWLIMEGHPKFFPSASGTAAAEPGGLRNAGYERQQPLRAATRNEGQPVINHLAVRGIPWVWGPGEPGK